MAEIIVTADCGVKTKIESNQSSVTVFFESEKGNKCAGCTFKIDPTTGRINLIENDPYRNCLENKAPTGKNGDYPTQITSACGQKPNEISVNNHKTVYGFQKIIPLNQPSDDETFPCTSLCQGCIFRTITRVYPDVGRSIIAQKGEIPDGNFAEDCPVPVNRRFFRLS
jgi:hypothetical protein